MKAPRPRRLVLVLALALAGLAALAAWRVASGAAEATLAARLDQNLILTARAIETEIERFRYLPAVVAEDARIRALVARPEDLTVAAANPYLERVAAEAGAAQLYVLNDAGTAMATSNWNTSDNLTGNTYDFRPYFRQALETGVGRYYAIGVTTGKPGYFMSYRMTAGGRTGVVVVKVELRALEAAWRDAGLATAIADRDGVVFLSGPEAWAYRPLRPLAPEALERIHAERTYEGVDIAAAVPILPPGGSMELPVAEGPALTRTRALLKDGWTVIESAPLTEVRAAAALWASGAGLLALVLTAVGYALWQRQQIIRLRLSQREVLERRVAVRTRELADEIESRRRVEAELREAQEGLIHAAKMAALGRMSAAIVHEVSQPLTAMEVTLAAAGRAGEKGDTARVAERLASARSLIGRMQRTIKHLKTFSRRDRAERARVPVDDVIANTLDLAEPRARAVGVLPQLAPGDAGPSVWAVPERLEQVLLNLVLNALDAVQGRPGAAVTISRGRDGDDAIIRVQDTGAGIEPDILPRVTEPFFSTKVSGEGLGLGLSISAAIVQEFGGALTFASTPGVGTVAEIRLPAAGDIRTEAA